jgi:hypothetical protein
MKNRFLASTVVLLAVIAVASIASVPAAAQTPKRPHYHWFVFFQFWPGTRPLESDYAKYIKEADDNRDFVENQIQKGATLVKPTESVDYSPSRPKKEKPSKDQGLFHGAGEEGRTPDLMLGKHTL